MPSTHLLGLGEGWCRTSACALHKWTRLGQHCEVDGSHQSQQINRKAYYGALCCPVNTEKVENRFPACC